MQRIHSSSRWAIRWGMRTNRAKKPIGFWIYFERNVFEVSLLQFESKNNINQQQVNNDFFLPFWYFSFEMISGPWDNFSFTHTVTTIALFGFIIPQWLVHEGQKSYCYLQPWEQSGVSSTWTQVPREQDRTMKREVLGKWRDRLWFDPC